MKINFIGVELIYTFVLVSAVQQSESVNPSINGISQARILGWVAIFFSRKHIHTSTLFFILCLYRSLQNVEFPVLHSRSLLVTYSRHSGVCNPKLPLYPILDSFPPWYPQACSPHQWLYLCLVNRFICSNMDGLKAWHAEWRKSEQDKHMISLIRGI